LDRLDLEKAEEAEWADAEAYAEMVEEAERVAKRASQGSAEDESKTKISNRPVVAKLGNVKQVEEEVLRKRTELAIKEKEEGMRSVKEQMKARVEAERAAAAAAHLKAEETRRARTEGTH